MKMGNRILTLCCAIVALFVVSTSWADTPAEFGKANQEYAAGHFKEAADAYEQVVRAGAWSANLFYDLGNAYFHSGDFGHAILNYERALALDRHHPEAQANLRIARDEARALELAPTRTEHFAELGSANQYRDCWRGCILDRNFLHRSVSLFTTKVDGRNRDVDLVIVHLRPGNLVGVLDRDRKQRPRAGGCHARQRSGAAGDGG